MNYAKWIRKSVYALALGTALVACDNSNELLEEATVDDTAIQSIEDNAYTDAIMEEVTDFGEEAIATTIQGGRSMMRQLPECASVIHDRQSKTVTIDFGDGCTGPRGNLRTGAVIIAYTGRDTLTEGIGKEITFQNYTVNGNQVEGVIQYTAVRDRSEGTKEVSCQITNFSVTFAEDQSIFQLTDADRVRSWEQSQGTVTLSITGSSTGINRQGEAFTTEITSPIVRNSDCSEGRMHYPVSGIKVRTVEGKPNKSIDFGDGSCDNKATIIIGDQSREITLRD